MQLEREKMVMEMELRRQELQAEAELRVAKAVTDSRYFNQPAEELGMPGHYQMSFGESPAEPSA